jgi:hypothetical protein
MPDIEAAEAKPAPTYHLDRASKRTDAVREAHFEHWWAKQEVYRAAVLANGGTPWTQDVEEARILFSQRYLQPEPPADLSVPDVRGTS